AMNENGRLYSSGRPVHPAVVRGCNLAVREMISVDCLRGLGEAAQQIQHRCRSRVPGAFVYGSISNAAIYLIPIAGPRVTPPIRPAPAPPWRYRDLGGSIVSRRPTRLIERRSRPPCWIGGGGEGGEKRGRVMPGASSPCGPPSELSCCPAARSPIHAVSPPLL